MADHDSEVNMKKGTPSVDAYLDSLPEDRRTALSAVRKVILKNLDASYEEGIQYGMIGYYVPHRVYPKGYHCDPKQPLGFAALGSQKSYMTLHLMPLYSAGEYAKWFREAWESKGKRLDMGKACIRFKKLEDVPLDVIGEAFRRVPASAYIAQCEAAIAGRAKAAKSKAG